MQTVSLGKFFTDLFRPLPEEKNGSFASHVHEYLETTDGSQALFELVARAFETIKMAAPCADWVCCAEKVQEVFDTSALALDLPGVLSAPQKFFASCSSLYSPALGDMRSCARRVKEVAYSGVNVVKSGAKAVLFSGTTNCLALTARQLLQVSIIAAVTTLAMDSADLVRDVLVLGQEGHSGETALLALTNVIKNVASVVAGIFVWISLALPHISIAPLLPTIILVSGLIFSVTKISSYFIKEMMVEPSSCHLHA